MANNFLYEETQCNKTIQVIDVSASAKSQYIEHNGIKYIDLSVYGRVKKCIGFEIRGEVDHDSQENS